MTNISASNQNIHSTRYGDDTPASHARQRRRDTKIAVKIGALATAVVAAIVLTGCSSTTMTTTTTPAPSATTARSVSPPPGESPITNVPTQGVPPTTAPTEPPAPTPQPVAPTEPPAVQPLVPPVDAPVDAPAGCPQGCTTQQPGCDIKGNISSKDEKIYHEPGASSYAATVISPEKGERWFCTVAEAVANGWRAPRN